ncbi:SdrD B-like domain-containing protein [Aridibaculum aurantiacum]|uniref:SdrD B-like domain-containing protein n=1 Tax=Aridibaculum aurantiacum TaxID=2810307 RepID=UPI001A967DE4|nr:SdrD B-like domain-containing protein [Aridibaculum aurantiacum]
MSNSTCKNLLRLSSVASWRKTGGWGLLLFALFQLMSLGVQAQTYNCPTSGTTTGGHKVVFNGVTYAGSGSNTTSQFSYTITSGYSPSISHFKFGTEGCTNCFDDASDFAGTTGGTPSYGTDPHTKLCGIKFDNGINGGSSKTVTFKLKGYYSVGTIKFAVKAGQNVEYVDICGPICSTPPPVNNSSIGDFVWNDLNKNGKQDAGEPGIANATVTLTLPGGLTRNTTTNNDGFYQFTGLSSGTYRVTFSTPAGFTPSPSNVGDDTKDSDPVNGSVSVTLNSNNQVNNTIDAGFYQSTPTGTGKIGDFVWNDLDKDGIQDNGEPGISGVTVTLTGNGLTLTTTTDGNGKYQFNNLPAGQYTITFTTPSGLTPSPAKQGGNDAKDSDPSGGSVIINLAAGQTNNNIDAGFYDASTPGSGKIGNFVWNDLNKNGIQDAGEQGISNVTVTLTSASGAPTTTTTNANGYYQFVGLNSGNYTITFTTPNGFTPTVSNAGSNDEVDSDPTNGSVTVNLANGQIDNSIDAGFYTTSTSNGVCPPNSVVGEGFENGSFSGGASDLHHGLPRNGSYQVVQNVNQLGGGGYLNITPRNGNFFLAAHTSNDVNDKVWYQTVNVAPNTEYTFCFAATLLKNLGGGANYQLGLYVNGQSIGQGRVTFDWTQICGTYKTGPGQTSLELSIRDPKKGLFFVAIDDICFSPSTPAGNLTLGNLVWNDRDGDGKRDSNEPGIAGATISLYTDNDGDDLPDGAAIRTTTTDENGNYVFTGLHPGRYIASMPILPGYSRSPNNTTGGTVDTPKPGCCSLDPDADEDNDNNLVRLVGSNGPGGVLYTKAITLSQGGEPTNDGDDANGNLTLDLAQCGNAYLGDFVWNDQNGNGIQDPGEPGINGVKVILTFQDGTIDERYTHRYHQTNNQNAPQYNGYYDFPSLGPGTYTITFETPAGYTPSPANQGGNDAKDSDPINGSVQVTVVADQSDFTIDAGFISTTQPAQTFTLGNLVWNDYDGDGQKDDNEYGIPNYPVRLYRDTNGDNLPDGEPVAETITDAQGFYQFNYLSAGDYIVNIPILKGYIKSGTRSTSFDPNNNLDNDNNAVNVIGDNAEGGELFSNAITLEPGQEPEGGGYVNNTLDMAVCGLYWIGNFVWNDLNGNGIQEPGEKGINGVTVEIRFSDGTTGKTTTHTYHDPRNPSVDNDGYYDFKNLGPGTFVIIFPTSVNGMNLTTPNSGSDDKVDSDPSQATGEVTVVLVDKSDHDVDAGYSNGTPPPPPSNPCPETTNAEGNYGGFELGYNSFGAGKAQTQYSRGMPRNGAYEIVKKASDAGGGGYRSLGPQSGSYFMLSHTRTSSNNKIWYKDVYVVEGQKYSFCAWIANAKAEPTQGFRIDLIVDGTSIENGVAVYNWSQVCGTYTATKTGNVTFEIRDLDAHTGPSHFLGLDGICIGPDNTVSRTANPTTPANTGFGEELTENCNLKVTLAPTDPLCKGHVTGKIKTTVTGNTGALTYTWSNGSTGANLVNVGAGSYYVKVKDKETGCEVTSDAVELTDASKMVVTLSSPEVNGYNVLCTNGNNGSIELKVTGGKGAYSYTWNNGATTANLTNVVAGKYTVVVKDESQCPAQASIVLKEPKNGLLVEPTVKAVDCNNPSGSVALRVTGGAAPYTYTWSNGATSQNLDKVAAGNYTVTVKDAVGCEVSKTIQVKNNQLQLQVNADRNTLVAGSGITSNILKAEANGGTGDYTYTWSTSETLKTVGKNKATVNPTATTDYTVTVKDGAGCTATANVAVKVVNEVLAAKPVVTPTITVEGIKVSPNPTKGIFNLVLNGLATGKAEIRILDANGKEVANQQVNITGDMQTVPFNLVGLPRGIYFVDVVSSTGKFKEKVIIK